MTNEKMLWAPWRIGYILADKSKGCFLCAARKSHDDKKHHVLYRGRNAFVILNLFPYTNGHLMVVPNRHTRHVADVRGGEEIFRLVQMCVDVLTRTLRPHGFNVGLNIGWYAGAGIERHLHVHVVPRWEGDVNFMSAAAGTRVISQSLGELYVLLKKEFDKGDT